MENSKKQTIDKLYLTRALLSNISQNDEEIEKKEEEYKKAAAKTYKRIHNSKLKSKEARYQCLIRTPETSEYKIQKLYKDEEESDREIEKIKKDISDISKSSNIIEKIKMAVFMAAVATVGFFMFKWWMNTSYSFWVALLVVPVDFFALIFVVGGLVYLFSVKREEIKEKEKDLKIAIDKKKLTISLKESLEQSLKQSKDARADDIANLKIEIENLYSEEKARELEFNEKKKLELKEIEWSKKKLISKSSKLYESLKENAVIDERDWKNLDLIIYELETGRADTIKEALQQADLYVRHGEIIKVMENATTAICSSIKENIGRLSSSINFALSEIRYDLADINQSNREMSAKLDTMIDSQELSNALLKKADVSSEKLADSVLRIRQLKDYEHFGIR